MRFKKRPPSPAPLANVHSNQTHNDKTHQTMEFPINQKKKCVFWIQFFTKCITFNWCESNPPPCLSCPEVKKQTHIKTTVIQRCTARRHLYNTAQSYTTPNRFAICNSNKLWTILCCVWRWLKMNWCLRYSRVHPYATNLSGRMRNETIAFDGFDSETAVVSEEDEWKSEVVEAHERNVSDWNPVSRFGVDDGMKGTTGYMVGGCVASPREYYPRERQTLKEKDGLRCLLNMIAGWKIVSKHLVNGYMVAVGAYTEFNEQLLNEWRRAVSLRAIVEWFFRFWVNFLIGGNVASEFDEVDDDSDGLMHAALEHCGFTLTSIAKLPLQK